MKVHLGIVVESHLNDAIIEISINPELAKKRMKFVKALTFFNENLDRDITDDYLDYLWKEIEKGLWGMSFDKYNYETTNK